MKKNLLGKTKSDFEAIVTKLGGKKIHAKELANFIYKKSYKNIDSIITLPLELRRKIDEKYSIGDYPPIDSIKSIDGTIKYLFRNKEGLQFETVFMPSEKRNTLCVSTQSGCKMGCTFCLTGKLGFHGNLKSRDILNQFYSIPDNKKVNRIVFMGMGEPLDNYIEVKKSIKTLTANWGFSFGRSNITLSTVGIKAALKNFLEEPLCNLAISLNSPFADDRAQLMPIERTQPIQATVDLIRNHPLPKPLRVSFEYVALSNTNLSEEHAKSIGNLLTGIKCHLNIIPVNEVGQLYSQPQHQEVREFAEQLNKYGILASVRDSRGQDIGAACGQLAYNYYKSHWLVDRLFQQKKSKIFRSKEKVAFVVNPISGGSKSSVFSDNILKFIDKKIFKPTIAETKCKGDAQELAKKFVEDGYRLIVAVGGDGTVNEVAHSLIHTNTVLGIIPKGSGNGLARHLNIPTMMYDSLDLLSNGRIINIDYGVLNEIPFFCTAGVGFDALVGNKFATLSGRGLTNYLKTIISEYFNYKPQFYRIEINGQIIEKEAFLVTIANASQWGNNAFIAPDADLQDGLLDVTIVSPFPKYLSPSIGIQLLNKEIGKSGYVQMFKVKEITIIRDKPGYVHYDGEPSTMGEKLISQIVPNGLKVIVP